jgi:hypothetical protein
MRYRAEVDDSFKKLDIAKFSRHLLSLPQKFFKPVLPKRYSVFRCFPLAHYGMESQVKEGIIVKMHDKQVAVEVDMLARCNYNRRPRNLNPV